MRAETKPYNIFPRRHNNVLKYSSLSMNIKSDCCFNLREHEIYIHFIFNPTQCVQYTNVVLHCVHVLVVATIHYSYCVIHKIFEEQNVINEHFEFFTLLKH